jgi:pyruvate,water dikinase
MAGHAPREATAPAKASGARAVLAFGDPDCAQVARAGGKGASLARLSALGLPVPPGFVVPADRLVASLPDGGAALRAALPDAAQAQAAVARADPPPEIGAAYEALGDAVPVAVRSSACAEDSETASYAGQQETFLHVRGADAVRARVRDCWASFFSKRALFYRERRGSLDDLAMAVVVQRMVQADVAGVLFTCHPVQRRRDRMVVEAVLGLGEAAVSGQITPDHYVIKRDGTVKRARIATQPFAIVAAPDGGTRQHRLAPAEGSAPKLGDRRLRELARIGDDLERRLGCPQDIEWAIEEGKLYVLQARPVTTR